MASRRESPRARFHLVAGLVLVLVAVAGAFLAAVVLGPPAATPVPRIEEGATLVVDRQAVARIDLGLVHRELVPAWVVARGGIKHAHWDRLRREAGQDANLGALLDRMAQLIEAGPVLNASELLGLVRTWNHYLAAAGEPWRLGGEITMGPDGGTLRLKSYEVLFEGAEVRVGAQVVPASVRHRVDQTTQVDGWLGHVHSADEGVVLLLDQVIGFALDRVWPMLDPALDAELTPIQRAFAPRVRLEVATALGPGAMEVLAATAADRWWLLRTIESVHARHACGSQFVVSRMPWNGLSPRDLATLQLHATAGAGEACPDVTEHEALAFATRSHRLRTAGELDGALQRLVAWVAGAVAVHEARHAADVANHGRHGLPCPGCAPATTRVGVLEGSAYIASFAHDGIGALALYQACGLEPAQVPERAAIVAELVERLGMAGCTEPPPLDLARRAAAVEQALYGRSEPVALAAFPDRLPIGLESAP